MEEEGRGYQWHNSYRNPDNQNQLIEQLPAYRTRSLGRVVPVDGSGKRKRRGSVDQLVHTVATSDC
jgi:hypothetical protein